MAWADALVTSDASRISTSAWPRPPHTHAFCCPCSRQLLAHSDRRHFDGRAAAFGALRTWLDLQLARPDRD
jgi:hypothetical protein